MSAPLDPASVKLAIETGGVAFRNPVLTASGTFGYGREFEGLTDLRSLGGLVTRALEARLDKHRGARVRVMGCGPNAMLWAVARLARDRDVPCFISLEEQMACGIGVCLGCAIPARSRPYRYVCSNGPVFDAADVLDVNTHSPKLPPPPSECPA